MYAVKLWLFITILSACTHHNFVFFYLFSSVSGLFFCLIWYKNLMIDIPFTTLIIFFYDFLIQPAWLPLLYMVNIIITYLSWRTSSLFFLLFENCWIRLQNLLVICDISSLLLICICENWNLQCEIMVRHHTNQKWVSESVVVV